MWNSCRHNSAWNHSWYVGTADAIYQNIDIIRTHNPHFILILAGDHIYKMDYGTMLAAHVERGADITVGCIEVPLEQAHAFGIMAVDEYQRIIEFVEKPAHPTPMSGNSDKALASMGIYVFRTEVLVRAADQGRRFFHLVDDFGEDIIPHHQSYRVTAFPFRDPEQGRHAYWRDVGTVDAFWEANMELIGVSPSSICTTRLADLDLPGTAAARQIRVR